MSDAWFKTLFIDEAKAALNSANAGGGSNTPSPDEGYYYLPYVTGGNLLFGNVTFPENTELTIDAPHLTDMSYMFANTSNLVRANILSIGVTPISCAYCANNTRQLVTLDVSNIQFMPKVINNFNQTNSVLKEILGEIDLSLCTNMDNAFGSVYLETIRIKTMTLKLSVSFSRTSVLSDESIQSIIDGLADLTETDAMTISFHSSVTAKLTDEQLTQITSKNWTLG